MATTVNYTSLFTDITRYIERGESAAADPTVHAQIPRLINAAERKIIQKLKLLGEKEVLVDATSIVAGTSVITKPDRWRETVSINIGTGAEKNSRKFLFAREYEYCRFYWPDDSVRDVPEFYADYDLQHWLIVPTADDAYPMQAICYMQPVLLDSSNQTNFFTDYTPNLLLYGALLEATPFLKNDSRLPVWQRYYDDELASLQGQDLQRILDQAAERRGV